MILASADVAIAAKLTPAAAAALAYPTKRCSTPTVRRIGPWPPLDFLRLGFSAAIVASSEIVMKFTG
jgi:hypothetical protein